MTSSLLTLQATLHDTRTPYAQATVVEILGSSSAKCGAKALFDASGVLLAGWVGGGCAQSMIAHAARDAIACGDSRMLDVDLNDEVFGAGMPCGGSMRVFIEPILPPPLLWLMGHGRIVETLCSFASQLGFSVIVDDAQATPQRFPLATRLIDDDVRYQQLQPLAGDFVVIATHHKGDYDALMQAIASEARYIALVSSRKRAALVLGRLADEGLSDDQRARIRAPAGLDLGAKTPEEIALAIVSEMVLIRRGGSGRPLQAN